MGECCVEWSSHCRCITLLDIDCSVYIAVAAALLFASLLALAHCPAHNVNKASSAVQCVWFGWRWGQGRSLVGPFPTGKHFFREEALQGLHIVA